MRELSVTTIQTALYWNAPSQNRTLFESYFRQLKHTDLVVLPEMFTTGFSMDAEALCESWDNSESVNWLRSMSKMHDFAICGSLIIKDGNNHFNRLVFVHPDGKLDVYDKKHLFRMAREDEHYSPGSEKTIVSYKGWNICPLVCYDLRFPVWSRNVDFEYDLLIYVANWPAPRSAAWSTLLQARAIENLSYVVGVNRIGMDGNDVNYNGHTGVSDFKGNYIYQDVGVEKVRTTILSRDKLDTFRKAFPAHLDADDFKLL